MITPTIERETVLTLELEREIVLTLSITVAPHIFCLAAVRRVVARSRDRILIAAGVWRGRARVA
jgi:hypothetical protein